MPAHDTLRAGCSPSDAPRPAYSPPKIQLLDLAFGWALTQQGYSGEQAAAYLRRVQAAREAEAAKAAVSH